MDSNRNLLFTIGHSNHTFETFLDLLRPHGIMHLVDVRSQPYSRRFPQFNIKELKARLPRENILYTFLGDHLGGRPKDTGLYDQHGALIIERFVASPDFIEGIERMVKIAEESTTAIMCAEEDPGRCHRGTILTPALEDRGLTVRHIRRQSASGRNDKHEQLALKM